jgi:membrane-bound serine protease (ClpP class)
VCSSDLLLWLEITHPGLAAPGILGIACFVTFFIVKYSLHYAHMLEILLFAAGLVLLLIEVFFIPGFGLVGVLGIGLLFVSIVLMFQQFTFPRTPSESIAFGGNILTVFASFLVALAGMVIIVRHVGSIPVLSRIVRRETLEGVTVAAGLKPGEPDLRQLVGQSGVALTPLHPAGHVEFGDRLVDVVTEGEFVEKGAQVEAVAVHGRQVIVKAQRET